MAAGIRVVEGWREGTVREFRMDMYTLLYLKWIANKDHCTAHGTLLNAMWPSGQEGNLGENGYMYMYGWVPSLFTWNHHNIVYQSAILQCKIKRLKKKKNEKASFLKCKEPQSAESCYLLCKTKRKCKLYPFVLLPERITEIKQCSIRKQISNLHMQFTKEEKSVATKPEKNKMLSAFYVPRILELKNNYYL